MAKITKKEIVVTQAIQISTTQKSLNTTMPIKKNLLLFVVLAKRKKHLILSHQLLLVYIYIYLVIVMTTSPH